MSIDETITTVGVDSGADNGKVPTYNSTTKVFDMVAAGSGASTALDNLASVAINTSLISDTDITDDLGTGDIRWRDVHAASLNAGLTANDTLKLRGRDVDGAAYVDILTITSANTVIADLHSSVTLGSNTIATTNLKLDAFASTTSAELAGIISDETGTGLLVFNDSPTLITPALGTPASGVMTNVTGLPEAGLLDNAVTLAKMAGGTDGNLITYDTSGDPAFVTTGTADQVLTSNGAGAAPTFKDASAGGGDPTLKINTVFETAGRFAVTLDGAATSSFGDGGILLDTSTTGTSAYEVVMSVSNQALELGSPEFGVIITFFELEVASNTSSAIYAIGEIGVNGTSITFTTDHLGFKTLKTGGVVSFFATQADGTTENASSALTTVVNGNELDMVLKANGTTSADYFFRKDSGALSSATNLTSNYPDTLIDKLQVGASNETNSEKYRIRLSAMSYQR